ncbi:MAG TPA: tRNA guanosine(34) transglycosylase Tgt [Candidatus Paceibacterota bacterium]
MRPISFSIAKKLPNSSARAGVLSTPHGSIMTPAFVAVGTKADVKGIDSTQFGALGVQTIIANTYHLYLSPGEKLIEKAGGIHQFMGWSGPVMTDSGGFQVFSLGEGFGKKISKFSKPEPEEEFPPAHLGSSQREPSGIPLPVMYDEDLATSHGKLAIIDDDGVTFTSHLDGSLHRFTPERSVEIQHKLGGDIFFAFDQCTAPNASYEFQKEAMERTHRWAKRSLAAHRQNFEANQTQAIYGIAQGGQFDDLRKESARTIGEMGFDGFGLGGSFSKKYGENSLQSALAMLKELPPDMPVHGLGVGEPEDILLGVAYGVDTFDCVIPTRNGRNGGLFTSKGKIQIPNAEYVDDFGPIEDGCDCPVCIVNEFGQPIHTRAYVHHLFRTHEMLGQMLASQHNIRFLTRLMEQIRESILQGNFEQFRDEFLSQYKISQR